MTRTKVLACLCSVTTLAVVVLNLGTHTAYAASPNFCVPASCPTYIDPSLPQTQQYQKWLALKNAGRIRAGIQPNQPKGTLAHPYVGDPIAAAPLPHAGTTPYSIVFPCQQPGALYPCSSELSTVNAVPTTWEPGDGQTGYAYNYGWGTNGQGTPSFDDYGKNYYDTNFWGLCGPGAADVALWYWPWPPNTSNYTNVADPKTGTTTTWFYKDQWDNVERMRGYLVHLAWQLKAPTWSQPGMMEQYAGGGVTLQTKSQAMNWEASGENTTDWQGYFYALVWWNTVSQSTFYNDVQLDVVNSHVPVVAEVNAQLMPNWTNNFGSTHHLITIIGYNDLQYNQSDGTYGAYYYTDTCGNSTKCGSNTDGGVHTASYMQMWAAITNISVNQSTGDGGYIW